MKNFILHILKLIIFFIIFSKSIFSYLIIPMDESQKDHLRAYGVVYNVLTKGQKAIVLLNYKGGSFLIPENEIYKKDASIKGVSYEEFSDNEYQNFKKQSQTKNINSLTLEKAPKIAIYKPPSTEPWDDAVTMALQYAKIPFTQIWDKEILKGDLNKFDWLHLHHEDFTGQYGKFYAFARHQQWYQKRRILFEKMAKEAGFNRVADEKKQIAITIQKYVADGGFLFAMCSATDTLDIALAAQEIDIISPEIDNTPITPNFNKKLNFNFTFAFKNFKVYPNPMVYEFSDIDINPRSEGIMSNKDFFTLFEFNAQIDPIPTLLTQNHVRQVKGFLGQTTAFQIDKIKSRVLILGQTLGTSRVKYIYGGYKKGFFSYYAGHDPEDYQHLVGDPPTNLALHKNSAGYRLILNNIFLPAAKKKKRKT